MKILVIESHTSNSSVQVGENRDSDHNDRYPPRFPTFYFIICFEYRDSSSLFFFLLFCGCRIYKGHLPMSTQLTSKSEVNYTS